MDETNEVWVDVAFPLAGASVPLDHGYPLFGAVASVLGDLHGVTWLAIHPLRGTPLPGKALAVARHKPALRLRVELTHIPQVLELAGKTLRVAGTSLHVGTSRVFPIRPQTSLIARMVIIKGFTEEGPFLEAIGRQLEAMDAKCDVEVRRRRVTSIAGDKVVGFGVKLSGLDEEASMRVQYRGLGGRQRMGCGVFVPLRERGQG